MFTADARKDRGILNNQQGIISAKRYAFHVFNLYCFVYYLSPAIIIVFFGNALENVIRPRPNYMIGFSYVLFSWILFTLVLKLPTVRLPVVGRNLARLAFDARLSLIYAAIFVGFALATRSVMTISFRQTGSALADVGAIGFILQFLKVFFAISILVHYRLVKEKKSPKTRSKALLLIACGFFLSIQASLDVLFIFCALAASGMKWERVFGLHLKIVRQLSIAIVPLIAFGALFVGIANKMGVEQALQTIQSVETVFRLASSRLSYHFTSTSMHATENFFNFMMFFEAIQNVSQTVLYRFSVLFGGEFVSKPEVVSVSRMNFLELTLVWKDRTGASPSVLGSVFYLPGAGFAIFYYVFAIRCVTILIGRIMSPHLANIPFLLLSMVTLSAILDSALDTLNPLSLGFMRLFWLYLGSVYVWQIVQLTDTIDSVSRNNESALP